MKNCLVYFVFSIYAGRGFCEPSMWCYLLGFIELQREGK
jgi:hypothetical protein